MVGVNKKCEHFFAFNKKTFAIISKRPDIKKPAPTMRAGMNICLAENLHFDELALAIKRGSLLLS